MEKEEHKNLPSKKLPHLKVNKYIFHKGNEMQEMEGQTCVKSLLIGLLIVCCLLPMASAWPYQLNMSNGTLYDLNSSNNATANFTIYVVTQNITHLNNTNITYLNITYSNVTCVNCTYLNNTNYTYVYTLNGTNSSYYNSTYIDTVFVKNAEFNSYKTSLIYPYASQIDFNALILRVNDLNNRTEIIEDNNGSHNYLWGAAIVTAILALVGIYLAYKAGSGGEYSE